MFEKFLKICSKQKPNKYFQSKMNFLTRNLKSKTNRLGRRALLVQATAGGRKKSCPVNGNLSSEWVINNVNINGHVPGNFFHFLLLTQVELIKLGKTENNVEEIHIKSLSIIKIYTFRLLQFKRDQDEFNDIQILNTGFVYQTQ